MTVSPQLQKRIVNHGFMILRNHEGRDIREFKIYYYKNELYQQQMTGKFKRLKKDSVNRYQIHHGKDPKVYLSMNQVLERFFVLTGCAINPSEIPDEAYSDEADPNENFEEEEEEPLILSDEPRKLDLLEKNEILNKAVDQHLKEINHNTNLYLTHQIDYDTWERKSDQSNKKYEKAVKPALSDDEDPPINPNVLDNTYSQAFNQLYRSYHNQEIDATTFDQAIDKINAEYREAKQ